MRKAYTGSLAAHVIRGVTKMVIKRSLRSGKARAAMIAGMAHAMPPTRLTALRPPSPNRVKSRSPTNPNLAMAPLCSSRAVKPKSIMIWGKKMRTPLSPAKTPSTRRLFHHESCMVPAICSMPAAIAASSHSMGAFAQE